MKIKEDFLVEEIRNVGNALLPHPSEHPSGGERLVKQADSVDADINNIMRKWTNQGVLPHLAAGEATYGDFSDSGDYQEALNRVLEADEQFAALPAEVRDYCDNDPGKFLDLVQDEKRVDEMKKLGLIPEALPEKVSKVEVVNPQPAKEPAPAQSGT